MGDGSGSGKRELEEGSGKMEEVGGRNGKNLSPFLARLASRFFVGPFALRTGDRRSTGAEVGNPRSNQTLTFSKMSTPRRLKAKVESAKSLKYSTELKESKSPRRSKPKLDASRRFKYMTLSIESKDYISPYPSDETEAAEFCFNSETYYTSIGYAGIYKLLEPGDFIISVEHCCNCEFHNTISLRHDSSKYLEMAHDMLKSSSKIVHGCNLNIRLGVARLPILGHMRYGAFEVTAIYKDLDGEVQCKLLHSKLESTFWPSKYMVRRNLKAFLNECKIPMNEDDQSIQEPWSELKLSEDSWSFSNSEDTFSVPAGLPYYQSLSRSCSSPFPVTLSPMKARPGSPMKGNRSTIGFVPQCDMLWVFDSKDEEDSGLNFEAKSLPAVVSDKPSYELIRARIDSFGGSYPSECMACGTVESFEISEEYLHTEIEGELQRRIMQQKYCKLSAALGKHSDVFKIEAMALPATNSSSGGVLPDAAAALVKFRVTFDRVWHLHLKEGDENGDLKSNVDLSWFGPNTVYIGSPEGDIIGVFDVLIGPPLEVLPSVSYLFTDPISKEGVTSKLIARVKADKGMTAVATFEDSTLVWSAFNIPSTLVDFLTVEVETQDFEIHTMRLFYCMGLYNTRASSHNVSLQRKLLPELMTEVPSLQLLSAKAEEVKPLYSRSGGTGVFEYNQCGTVVSYQVSREMWKQIRASKCELWKRICRNTKSVVSVVMTNTDRVPCKELIVSAMAEPAVDGEHKRIGPTIKILINGNVAPLAEKGLAERPKHFGRKLLLIGGPDGILFDSLMLDVQPPVGSSTARILADITSQQKAELGISFAPTTLTKVTCGDTLSFCITYASLDAFQKEMIWQLKNRGVYYLHATISNPTAAPCERCAEEPEAPPHSLVVDAVAISDPVINGATVNHSFIVRVQLKVDDTIDSAKFNMANYGIKKMELFGATGVGEAAIFSQAIEVLPELILRPGRHYNFFHALHNVALEMPFYGTITTVGKDAVKTIEGQGTLDLPGVEHGVHEVAFSADGFDDTVVKFVQYKMLQPLPEQKKLLMNPAASLQTGEVALLMHSPRSI